LGVAASAEARVKSAADQSLKPILSLVKVGPQNAKGNMTSGNRLTIAYTAFNKPATITRGTTSISFDHDPEHQRCRAHWRSVMRRCIVRWWLAWRIGGLRLPPNPPYIAGGRLIGVYIERLSGAWRARRDVAALIG